jgi:hypothetical protein
VEIMTTAAGRKVLRLRGMIDGLHQVLGSISDADGLSCEALASCRAIIEREIEAAATATLTATLRP